MTKPYKQYYTPFIRVLKVGGHQYISIAVHNREHRVKTIRSYGNAASRTNWEAAIEHLLELLKEDLIRRADYYVEQQNFKSVEDLLA